MAAAYGQSPDHFDDWDVARFERELEIYNEMKDEGDIPLTAAHLAALFGGG